MELLESRIGEKAQARIKTAGKVGPLWGGILGAFPQCGFSAAASSLYAGRVITVGTLIAIYLSTSDEMLPIFISEAVSPMIIVKIIGMKMVIGMITGFLVEFLLHRALKKQDQEVDIHHFCEQEHCNCGRGALASACSHTIKITIFIFLISAVINILIAWIGEAQLAGIFQNIPILGHLIAGVVGLIPNCAASVVITQLYLEEIISLGTMMSGLLVGAGVGLLILFRLNRNIRENLTILGILYAAGVIWGIVIDAVGIIL